MDMLSKKWYGKEYDEDGQIVRQFGDPALVS